MKKKRADIFLFFVQKSENLYKNRIASALPSYYLAVYSDRTLFKNSSFYHY